MNYARLADNPNAAIEALLAGEADGLTVATSGSTGTPRDVLIGAHALQASAMATVTRLGGPGAWLLALPTDRIGGAMVAIRAGLTDSPVATMPRGSFCAEGFTAAAAAMPRGRRYVSLVPTQVVRLLTTDQGRAALASFDAVLVGGAAMGALDRPDNIVETYGMTETSGGCVYNGDPLDGVDVAIADDDRILITGLTLADAYSDGDDHEAWELHDGVRWLRTSDLGRWYGGKLEVLGRVDDVINTGGFKVHPVVVERAIVALAGVHEVAVVGVDDAEWGQRVVAVVEMASFAERPLKVEDIRDRLADSVPRYALPRSVVTVRAMPRTAGGKIDRDAVAAAAKAATC